MLLLARDTMAIPILAAGPLSPCERLFRVRRWGEAPPCLYIGAKAHKNHPVAALRHPEIRSVENVVEHSIFDLAAARVVTFKARKVVGPFFIEVLSHRRMLKLQKDVGQIGRERLSCQPANVFENKGLWPRFSDHPDRFWPHVSAVGVRSMFSA